MTVTLRRTQKLATALPATSLDPPVSTTALGDWYANRFIVDRKPLLLLLSSRSLLPILLPARNTRTLAARLGEVVSGRLRRLGIDASLIQAEVAAMQPVHVAKTADRSVVGIMVDFASMAPYHLHAGSWDETTLPFVEAKLAKNPCYVTRSFAETIFPEQAAPALLAARWGAS